MVDIFNMLIGLAVLVVGYHGMSRTSRKRLNLLVGRWCNWLASYRIISLLNGRITICTSVVDAAEVVGLSLMLFVSLMTLRLCGYIVLLAIDHNYPLLNLPLLPIFMCSACSLGLLGCIKFIYKQK